ncbi:MAG: hypothetical protein HY696_06855 [Deltaproteobacteria bacterium]|nr:hypothetical protein [Deltaproteobacteria bacterium]
MSSAKKTLTISFSFPYTGCELGNTNRNIPKEGNNGSQEESKEGDEEEDDHEAKEDRQEEEVTKRNVRNNPH